MLALSVTVVLSAVTLWGSSTCPAPPDVGARLRGRLTSEGSGKLDVEIAHREGLAVLTLRTEGRMLAVHTLASGTCAELTEAAALVVAAWNLDFATVPPRPRATPPDELRAPVRGIRSAVLAPPQEDRHLWVSSFAGVQLSHDGRVQGPSMGTELMLAPRENGVAALTAVTWSGSAPLRTATNAARGSGWQVSFAPGVGLRQHFKPFVIELYLAVPVSIIFPADVRADPLVGDWISPSISLGLQGGAKLSLWEEPRFAVYLRAAVDVPLVNSARLQLAPAFFTMGFGFAWRGA